jgi:hypothetical protein
MLYFQLEVRVFLHLKFESCLINQLVKSKLLVNFIGNLLFARMANTQQSLDRSGGLAKEKV